MHEPNSIIPIGDVGIAGTETDSLLDERDHLCYRPDHELAATDSRYCKHEVAVESERRLVFANRLLISVLRAQHLGLRTPNLTFREVRARAVRRCRHGLLGQTFCACDV